MKFWIRFWKETVAQDLVEFALIVAVIALASILVVSGVRFALRTLYARQVDIIHQNLATPPLPAQIQSTKAVPSVVATPADAAQVSSDPSGPLNKGLMRTVYWAIHRFLRFTFVVILITVGLLYASSRRDAFHIPLGVFRPLRTTAGGPFISRNESKFTFSSVMSFTGYIVSLF